jgi:hypothetical protein
MKSINEFKDFIYRVDKNFEAKLLEDKKKMRYITIEKLRDFLIEVKIFSILLGENFHVEVFRRSRHILEFLS